jgi:hypothetical protein
VPAIRVIGVKLLSQPGGRSVGPRSRRRPAREVRSSRGGALRASIRCALDVVMPLDRPRILSLAVGA